MERDSKQIAIVGGGPSGCVCAYYLLKAGFDVTIFDKGVILRTLLPTGGGRCNFAHSEFDNKELVKNYPRGEKFLYSVFSRFSTIDTLSLFDEFGIKYYQQPDGRFFPESNSAKQVRNIILNKINKASFINEEVLSLEKLGTKFILITNKKNYSFSHVVLAQGGRSGYELLSGFGLKTIKPRPSLVGLVTQEKFNDLSGVVLNDAKCEGYIGDVLFTHFGISGPLVYKISSLKAFDILPYQLTFDFASNMQDFQEVLNNNPHKNIKNIISNYVPQKLCLHIFKDINLDKKAHQIDAKTRDLILERLHFFTVNVIATNRGEETVTAGGIDLDEIDSKTMMAKKVENLYCIGELLNIDGFCGGFNLQNAWSTAYICSEALSH